jgi:hypothetical protein
MTKKPGQCGTQRKIQTKTQKKNKARKEEERQKQAEELQEHDLFWTEWALRSSPLRVQNP